MVHALIREAIGYVGQANNKLQLVCIIRDLLALLVSIAYSTFALFYLCGKYFLASGDLATTPNWFPTSDLAPWYFIQSIALSQRTHGATITALWRQNDVVTSFWRHNDVIIAPCARWVTSHHQPPATGKCLLSTFIFMSLLIAKQ